MTDQKKGILIYLALGGVIAIGVIVLNAIRYDYAVTHLLCDGFFVAAVVLLGFGGLKYTRNQGVFDMLSYSFSTTFQLHYPFTKMNSPLEDRQESFADYKERKRAKRKPAGELLWAGLVYLILSLLLLAVDGIIAAF